MAKLELLSSSSISTSSTIFEVFFALLTLNLFLVIIFFVLILFVFVSFVLINDNYGELNNLLVFSSLIKLLSFFLLTDN